jgi:hypothetical protein
VLCRVVVELCCAALVGCSAEPAVPERSADAVVTTSLEDVRAVQSGATIDYNGSRTNDEVAARSDLVVIGTIGQIEAGPAYGDFTDEMADVASVVIEVRPDKYLKGEERDSSLYVGTMAGGDAGGVDAWRSALPKGLPVVVYGTMSPSPSPERGAG